MPYSKSEHLPNCIVLLLGGCETIQANPLIPRENPQDQVKLTRKEKKDALQLLHKDASNSISDFQLIENFFKSQSCDIWGSYPTRPRAYKAQAIEILKKFFRQPSATHIVYWGGHGRRGKGNWCFARNEELGLNELLALYRESFDPQIEYRTLVLIADTCYSGFWTKELQQCEEYELNIIIQAAAQGNEQVLFVDGAERPRSPFMRKLLDEQKNMTKQTDTSSFKWISQNQHPDFAMSHALMEQNKCVITDTGEEVVCLFGGFRFSRIPCQ